MRGTHTRAGSKAYGSLPLVFIGPFVRNLCKRAITLAAGLICCSLLAAPTSGDKVKRTVPLSAAAWTVDLKQYGWPKLRFPYALLAFHTSDLYLSNSEIIATTITHSPVEGLQKRNDPHHQYPFTLHAVVLDAASGHAIMAFSWGSDYRQMGVVPREDGSFAVFLGNRIDFYNADLTPRGELKLPQVTDLRNLEYEGLLSFSYSPSGETMLVQYDNADGPACVLVKGDTVSQTQPMCDAPAKVRIESDSATHVIGAAVSDEEMAATIGSDLDAMRVKIQRFQGPWRDLYHGQVWFTQFLNNDTMLISEWAAFRVVHDDGKTIWRQEERSLLSIDRYLFSYAQKSGLIALPDHDPGGPTVVTGAAVYDTFTRERIFRVRLDPKINRLWGLAISPNGKHLVIDVVGVMRSYDLPPRDQ